MTLPLTGTSIARLTALMTAGLAVLTATGVVRAETPLESFLIAERHALAEPLGFDSPTAPRGDAAFEHYLEVVSRAVDEAGDDAVKRAWQGFVAAGADARLTDPSFTTVLRDYGQHRYGESLIEATQRLVRCRSVDTEGVAPLQNEGFNQVSEIVEELARVHGFGYARLADGAVIELSIGDGPATLGVWGHLDVVPADTVGWDFDPWKAEVVDGVLQGRGTEDNKGPVMAAFFALLALRDAGGLETSSVILFAGFNEETTWIGIDAYIKSKPEPPRNVVIDADFPVVIGEKGFARIKISSHVDRKPLRICSTGYNIREFHGGKVSNQVPAHAWIRLAPIDKKLNRALFQVKRRVRTFNEDNSRARLSVRRDGEEIIVDSVGRAAHGSDPKSGLNAIVYLVEFLYEFNRTCSSPPHSVIWFINEFIREEVSGRGLGIANQDSVMGPTTVNVGIVRTSQDSCYVELNIRFPIGQTPDGLRDKIEERIARFNEASQAGLAVWKRGTGLDPIYTDPDDPMVRELLEAYREVFGEVGEPKVSAGTTYAKAVKNAVSFGPSAGPSRAHAANEYITIEELNRLLRAYATGFARLMRDSN